MRTLVVFLTCMSEVASRKVQRSQKQQQPHILKKKEKKKRKKEKKKKSALSEGSQGCRDVVKAVVTGVGT